MRCGRAGNHFMTLEEGGRVTEGGRALIHPQVG